MSQNQFHGAHWSGNTAWNMQTLNIWLTQTHTRRQMNTNEPNRWVVLLNQQIRPWTVNFVHKAFMKSTSETDIWKDKVYRHTGTEQGNTLSSSVVLYFLRLNDIAKLDQEFKLLRCKHRNDAGRKRIKARLHGKHIGLYIGRCFTRLTLWNPHCAHLFIIIHLSDSTLWLSKLTLGFYLNGQMHWRLILLYSHPPNSAVETPVGCDKWKLGTVQQTGFGLKSFTKNRHTCPHAGIETRQGRTKNRSRQA